MSDFQPLSGLVGRLPTTLDQSSNNPGQIDKNGFLKLLIEQMKHQDPLNPMDSQEYASSLAQFSTLEEMQNLNSTTDQGVQANVLLAQSINNTLASTLVGKNVKAVTDKVVVRDGEARSVSFNQATAGSVSITITNDAGEVVRTLNPGDLGTGEHTIDWNGKDDDGHLLADNSYNVSVMVTGSDGSTSQVTPFIIGKVEAVRYDATGAVLVVDGMRIGFGDVLEVREPDDSTGSGGLFGGLLSSIGM